MPCLSVSNVSYNYKTKSQTVYALREVSAEFERGKFYAVIGKSGSGKTTLLSLLAGLDKPLSGGVFYDGQNLSALDMREYRLYKTAVIYQNYNLFPLSTAIENVMLPLEIQKKTKKQAREAAENALFQVGLNDTHFKRFPHMLSGGEQQRVAIARSLAAGTEILLADEPTGNCDVENGAAIIKIMAELAKDENRCVVVVTHDGDVRNSADVTFEMRDGGFL